MADITEFQSVNCPLSGVSLVEAAAGTGKTYNIQNLFVRLVTEKELPAESILVVTYTEAAAAELRDRIHRALTFSLDYLSGQAPEAEEDRARQLLANCDSGRAETLLRQALRDFDECSISTIHGFCRRVLSENAFESGILFNSELEPDTRPYTDRLCADFFRRRAYAPETDLTDAEIYSLAGLQPEKLSGILTDLVPRPELTLDGSDGLLAAAEYHRTFRDLLAETCGIFTPGALTRYAGMLLKNSCSMDYLQRCEDILAGGLTGMSADDMRLLAGITRTKLLSSAKVRSRSLLEDTLNSDRLIAALTDVSDCLGKYRSALLLEALDFVRAGLERDKRRDNVMSFEDLLHRVHDGIAGGSKLLDSLQKKFKAGIIDEFQDTDRIQYEIFSQIFAGREDSVFFMVGDPRQAIYSFRGGDLATYRRADEERRHQGGNKYSLSSNYRSAAAMIEAVNRVFAGHSSPFASPDIGFSPVLAPEPRKSALLDAGGAEDPKPLRIHRLPDANGNRCEELCAGKILELLNSSWRLPGRTEPGIQPGDIAVLVYTGYEAEDMRRLLGSMGIPAVCTRTPNVFASEDALELQTVLQAVLEPLRRDIVCNALATPLCGWSMAEIASLTEPGCEDYAGIQQVFAGLGEKWRKASFFEIFSSILNFFEVRRRYPAMQGGERKLTNILQLGDILQQEYSGHALSPDSLLAFLASAIRDGGGKVAESEELLETDRASVRIMTVHGSKGLEFPVVMLPGLFRWHAAEADKKNTYHHDDGTLAYDISDSGEFFSQCCRERLQELLRLTYVALTRAKYRCHLFWGAGRNKNMSPLDWLFRMRDYRWTPDFYEDFSEAGAEDIPAELLDGEVADADGFYRPAIMDVRLECPEFHRQIDTAWNMLSYSSLSPRHTGAEHIFDDDRDAGDSGDAVPEAAEGIFAIPGGAAAGNAWHRIFEIIDFGCDDFTIREAAYLPLIQYGVIRSGSGDNAAVLDITCAMVRQVLEAALDCGDGRSFRLADLPQSERLPELEFSYLFRGPFAVSRIKELVAPYAAERLGMNDWPEWEREISGGYMNGFIDLVFRHDGRYYILDWKSNRLRGHMRNFNESGLRQAMSSSFYFLQYLFYTVALVKYLRMRLGRFDREDYESLFGGVFYIFLRGVSVNHPGRGVFFDRPPYDLICSLEEVVG